MFIEVGEIIGVDSQRLFDKGIDNVFLFLLLLQPNLLPVLIFCYHPKVGNTQTLHFCQAYIPILATAILPLLVRYDMKT